MVADAERPLRADAARNAERILWAARATFADLGPDAPLEEIARRADVGIRTLYNRFPSKSDLVRAVLQQAVADAIAPAAERALNEDDPLAGMVCLVEAAVGLAARELSTLAVARSTGDLTAELYAPFYEWLTLLARRAQDAGRLRVDLVPDDLPRIMEMLISPLWSMDPSSGGWRRYLALMFEGLGPAAATPLPTQAPLYKKPRASEWWLYRP